MAGAATPISSFSSTFDSIYNLGSTVCAPFYALAQKIAEIASAIFNAIVDCFQGRPSTAPAPAAALIQTAALRQPVVSIPADVLPPPATPAARRAIEPLVPAAAAVVAPPPRRSLGAAADSILAKIQRIVADTRYPLEEILRNPQQAHPFVARTLVLECAMNLESSSADLPAYFFEQVPRNSAPSDEKVQALRNALAALSADECEEVLGFFHCNEPEGARMGRNAASFITQEFSRVAQLVAEHPVFIAAADAACAEHLANLLRNRGGLRRRFMGNAPQQDKDFIRPLLQRQIDLEHPPRNAQFLALMSDPERALRTFARKVVYKIVMNSSLLGGHNLPPLLREIPGAERRNEFMGQEWNVADIIHHDQWCFIAVPVGEERENLRDRFLRGAVLSGPPESAADGCLKQSNDLVNTLIAPGECRRFTGCVQAMIDDYNERIAVR